MVLMGCTGKGQPDASEATTSSAKVSSAGVDADVYSTSTDVNRVPMKIALARALAPALPGCKNHPHVTAPGSERCAQAAANEATIRLAEAMSVKVADDINLAFTKAEQDHVRSAARKDLVVTAKKCMSEKWPHYDKGRDYAVAAEGAKITGLSTAEEFSTKLKAARNNPQSFLTKAQHKKIHDYQTSLFRIQAQCYQEVKGADYTDLMRTSEDLYAAHKGLRAAVENIIKAG